MNRKWNAFDISLAGMFAGLMAVGANITAIAPFMVVGGVPITLQTFFAMLAGFLLGSRLGAFSMAAYTFMGVAGAPVFSQFGGGLGKVVGPTFGFVLSFIAVAYIVGKITESKRSAGFYILAAAAGLAANYLIGTNWMYAAYHLWADAPADFTYSLVWIWMSVPLPKDALLAFSAVLFARRVERTALNRTPVQAKRTV